MSNHPNFDRTQTVMDQIRQGDYVSSFDLGADDIVWENGPGAGPWHRARGKDDLALMLMEFAGSLGDTFHQDGRCVYADDRVAISLIRETGTAPSGDQFDNLAVFISRARTTTHVSPVSGVLARLADQAKASMGVAGISRRLPRPEQSR